VAASRLGGHAGPRRVEATISRHLTLLEDAGVVTRVVDGRTRRLALQPKTLADAAEWLERQNARWERLFEAVGEYLEVEQ
jgi:DNA-binding transcriptional ArsR family regulator